KGLGRRMPFLAFSMTVFLLSLAGIPPLGGFFSKFVLFSSAVNAASFNQWFLALAISGVLNSALSLYYYARVIWYMYILDPEEGAQKETVPRPIEAGVFIALAIVMLTAAVEALRRCPEVVFVPPHFEFYGRASSEIMELLRRFADHLQPTGIEEGYLDVTERCGGSYARARDLAGEIKAAVRKEQRLTCSIGIAPTKAAAKIASDFEKPDGLTVVEPDHIVEFLEPFSVRKILGVGPKTGDRLKELGLETIGDLQRFNRQDLVELFGAFGEYIHDVAMGTDTSEVIEPSGPPESISTETTFEKDLASYEDVWPELEALVKSLHEQLCHEKFAYRTVTLKARYSNFETHTRARSLK